ncbi:MAG: stable inheritance protein KleA [Burkholderia sp.]
MNKTRIMPWIDQLSGVATTDFPARRDQIAALLDEAAELSSKADELRAKAYFQGCTLEGDAKGKWSIEEVEQEKHRVGW